MLNRLLAQLKRVDWILLSSVFLLISYGLVEIYSVSLGRGGVDLLNFKKQALFIIIGLALFSFFLFFDFSNLASYSTHLYFLGIFLLLSVLFFGEVVRGTRGWFYLGDFGIQPVEFIKIISIVFLAKYFAAFSLKVNQLKHLLISGGGIFVLILLVMAQPDFGSALILFLVWLSMIIVAGFDKKYLLVVFLIIAVSTSFLWAFYFQQYQKERVITFLNPASNPLHQGYNIAQAIIAVGAGGLTGRGIGFGTQSRLKFLPESQTDFIFAVIAEELGFLGVILVIVFFAIFFYRCLRHIKNINNDFGVFFILGVVSLIFIEMFINIGMNIGLLHVIGISLPFLSYGGSGLISNLVLIGITESIIVRSRSSF